MQFVLSNNEQIAPQSPPPIRKWGHYSMSLWYLQYTELQTVTFTCCEVLPIRAQPTRHLAYITTSTNTAKSLFSSVLFIQQFSKRHLLQWAYQEPRLFSSSPKQEASTVRYCSRGNTPLVWGLKRNHTCQRVSSCSAGRRSKSSLPIMCDLRGCIKKLCPLWDPIRWICMSSRRAWGAAFKISFISAVLNDTVCKKVEPVVSHTQREHIHSLNVFGEWRERERHDGSEEEWREQCLPYQVEQRESEGIGVSIPRKTMYSNDPKQEHDGNCTVLRLPSPLYLCMSLPLQSQSCLYTVIYVWKLDGFPQSIDLTFDKK